MSNTAQEQQLIQGQAGTLVSYPPELAQPTSCAARVAGPSLAAGLVAVAGVVDSVSGVVADVTPRGMSAIELAAPVAVVRGRRYLVVDSTTGARIVVESTETKTTDIVVLQSPLPVEVAAGALFLGYACTFPLTSSQVGITLGRGGCTWEATIAGRVVAWAQDWRVARRAVAYSLTATDVDQMSSYAKGMKPAGDDDWTESLRTSWWLYVAPALAAKGVAVERIVSWEVLNPWHLAALEHHLATTIPEAEADIRAEKKAAMVEARDLALSSFRMWIDDSDTMTPADPATSPLSLTTTFVTR